MSDFDYDDEVPASDQSWDEQRVDPGGLSPEALQLQADAQWAAAQAVSEQVRERALVDRVAELAGEFDVHSPEKLREVAEQTQAVKEGVFTSLLAQGYSVEAAARAVDAGEHVDATIRAGLEQQREQQRASAFEAGTSLEQWKLGRREAAAKRAAQGLPPVEAVWDTPSYRRQVAAMLAREERGRERRQAEREAFDRATGRRPR